MKQFDQVKAVFSPKRVDDLIPEAQSFIGKVGVFEASYLRDEPPFEGQFAMGIWSREGEWARFPAGWVPEEDLEILEVVQ